MQPWAKTEKTQMRISRMIQAIDAHACGEPGRVIVGGVLDVPGATMFEKMVHLRSFGDDLRKCMLREPRGYPAMCCNLILPPTDPRADAGFVIMEPAEYPPMSGTNTICVATVLIETGMIAVREPVTDATLETPAGLIRVRAEVAHGKVNQVTFENVPAFAVHLDAVVEVPQLGSVAVDVAYGGMFYVIADVQPIWLAPGAGRRSRHRPDWRDGQGGCAGTVGSGPPGKLSDCRRDDRPAISGTHDARRGLS